MNESLQMEPNVKSLLYYINEIQRGNIQVPAFQRDFVWDNKKKLDLFDSIKKGYPIGSVLLWQPNSKTGNDFSGFEPSQIGAYTITLPKAGQLPFYILDGYQRLSTLFGCLIDYSHTTLQRDQKEWETYFNIIYDLEENTFKINKKKFEELELWQIPIYRLIDGKEFFGFQKKLIKSSIDETKQTDYIHKYEHISNNFVKYQLPCIQVKGGSVTEAVDIFSRLNSMGAPITIDWVISALSFSQNRSFRLGTEIDKLLEELEAYNFQGLKRELILQCITNAFGKVHFDLKQKQLEELAKKPNFIDDTRKVLNNIKVAVKFLFEELLVLQHNLLPYAGQFPFIVDFFSKLPKPTKKQLDSLKKWFWFTAYTGYFSQYNLSQRRKASEQFMAFLAGEQDDPIFIDKSNRLTESLGFPKKIDLGSARAKASALFMLKYLNDFKSIKEADVQGYKEYNLFAIPKEKEKSENNPLFQVENSILLIDWDETHVSHRKIKKVKDLSFWLDSDENHDTFFITKEMKDKHRKGASPAEILNIRKDLIMKAEQKFVEQLGLTYRMITEESE